MVFNLKIIQPIINKLSLESDINALSELLKILIESYYQENFILVHFNFKLRINFALQVVQKKNSHYKIMHKNSIDVCIKIRIKKLN